MDEGADEGDAPPAGGGEAAGEGQEWKERVARKWQDWKERAARKGSAGLGWVSTHWQVLAL
ncbi:MAG: hypothetical protein ACXQS4_03430, partial [Methermicoccaceae archaeon]